MFKYKTEQELSEMTEKEREQYLVDKRKHERTEVEKKISDEVKSATENLATKEDLKGISDAVKDLKVNRNDGQKTLQNHLRQNKEAIQKDITKVQKNGGRVKLLEIKNIAAKGHTTFGIVGAGTTNTTEAVNEMGGRTEIIAPEIRTSELDEFFTVGTWDREARTYREYVRDNVEGSGPPAVPGYAAHVAERGRKPQIQWKLTRNTATLHKAAGVQIYTTEVPLLMDQVYNDTINLLRGDVIADYDDQMIQFVLASATALDVTGFATTFTKPSLYHVLNIATAKASNFRADRAFKKTQPNAIMLNPMDITHMKLAENADGSLVIPVFRDMDDSKFGGLRIIETTEVPEGQFVLGDFKKIQVDTVVEYRTEMGRINEQLLDNEFTVVGEKLYLRYLRNEYSGSIIKGDIAAIKTAITKV